MNDAAGAALPHRRHRPLRWSQVLAWLAVLVLLFVLPGVFTQGFARTLLSQIGIMIVLSLSYHLLLGESGMLSFGHAVYSGLGAFASIHAMNAIAAGWPLPMPLLPLVGGLGAAAAGVVFGYVTTRRAGTPFAMITLGIGEMVYASSLMFPGVFGGEGGVSADRTAGMHLPLPGGAALSLGPQWQVCYLIAAWCLLSMVAMHALLRTPLGRIANAVRDNPERAEFVGYNTQRVRWLMLILSSFFAGIGGSLSAINFEIVTAENVGALRSGGILLACFIGGAGNFFGPVLGAVVFVLFAVLLSDLTRAWQLYLGVFFVALVMFAPGGLLGLLQGVAAVLRRRRRRLLDATFGVLSMGLMAAVGLVLVIEMGYHHTLDFAQGPVIRVFGWPLDTDRAETWLAAASLLAGGCAGLLALRPAWLAALAEEPPGP